MRQQAVLDTSFWAIGFKVGLLGYAMGAFRILVPRAVETEICASDARYPQRLYPDTALFKQVREQLADPPDVEPDPMERFGAGEAAAIALARSTRSTLLINDQRPAELARNLGLAVVTCPGMIVLARSQQLISDHMARAMVEACARHGTAAAMLREASRLLRALEST